jgi:hypothetical protein
MPGLANVMATTYLIFGPPGLVSSVPTRYLMPTTRPYPMTNSPITNSGYRNVVDLQA